MLIKLNDGESVTIRMNFDKSEKPYSINIMRRGDALMSREFNKPEEENEKAEIKLKVDMEIGNFINYFTSDDGERENMNEVLNRFMEEVYDENEG